MRQRTTWTVKIMMLAFATTAHGQAVDTSGWVCEFCPFEEGHRADYSVGVTSVSEDSAYFGDATGYNEDGVYGNVDGEGSYGQDAFRLHWFAEDLAIDSRVFEVSAGTPGHYEFDFGYRELPRRRFDTTATVFQSSSGATLSVPPGWVGAPTTGSLTELENSLVSRDIESDRSILDLGFGYRPAARWSFGIDYRRQDHDGLNIRGGSTFTNASLLPMPFDYVTDEVDIALRHETESGFVSVRWYLSDFENGNAALTWDNPFASNPLADIGTLAVAQAPDSRYQQFMVNAGFTLAEQRTTLLASFAIGEIEQDSPFLPYTTNSTLGGETLPLTNLDGQVDTTSFAVAASSRIINKLLLRFRYHYDERDNKTPIASWNRVIVDSFISGDVETNVPYSFDRSSLRISGDYDLFDTVRVSAGYDRKEFDRDFQEVAEQTEDTGWGRVRWRPAAVLQVDVKGGASRRDVDSYNENFAATLGQNPLMRKYNLAYRYREFGEVSIGLSPAEVPLSVTLDAMFADDSYTRSELGVLSADDFRLAADIGWAISDDASAYLNFGFEDIESLQAGSAAFASPDWQATHDDDFTTFGAGFHVRNVADRFDIYFDYLRSDGASEIVVDSAGAGPSEFPDLETELDYLRVRFAYRRSERLEIDVDLRYQRFTADDWAIDGVGPATIPVVLSLGEDSYDEDVLMFGIGFRYRVGSAAGSATP